MALTAKQQRFVEEYCVDWNATQAAIRAGYKEKTAATIGWENLRKPEISTAIRTRRDEMALKADITPEWVRERLRIESMFRDEGASHAARIRAVELLGDMTGAFPAKRLLHGEDPDHPLPGRFVLLTPEQQAGMLGEALPHSESTPHVNGDGIPG